MNNALLSKFKNILIKDLFNGICFCCKYKKCNCYYFYRKFNDDTVFFNIDANLSIEINTNFYSNEYEVIIISNGPSSFDKDIKFYIDPNSSFEILIDKIETYLIFQ